MRAYKGREFFKFVIYSDIVNHDPVDAYFERLKRHLEARRDTFPSIERDILMVEREVYVDPAEYQSDSAVLCEIEHLEQLDEYSFFFVREGDRLDFLPALNSVLGGFYSKVSRMLLEKHPYSVYEVEENINKRKQAVRFGVVKRIEENVWGLKDSFAIARLHYGRGIPCVGIADDPAVVLSVVGLPGFHGGGKRTIYKFPVSQYNFA